MSLMNWLKKRSSDSTDNLDSPLKRRELDVEESPYKGQCSTQVGLHDVIDEPCEEIQEDEGELALENTSATPMSSSDDDNDFPACWSKGQCEMFNPLVPKVVKLTKLSYTFNNLNN